MSSHEITVYFNKERVLSLVQSIHMVSLTPKQVEKLKKILNEE